MRPLRSVSLLLVCAVLGGCGYEPAFMSFPPQVRGNQVDADAVGQLVPGTSTRADVTAAIGSPTAHASFDDNTWLYIGEVTQPVIAGTTSVDSQQVYVLRFDQQGVLKSVDHKTQKDSEDVDVVARTTPSPGNSATFLQQLLGNVGKFSPSAAPGTGGQGSATEPGNF